MAHDDMIATPLGSVHLGRSSERNPQHSERRRATDREAEFAERQYQRLLAREEARLERMASPPKAKATKSAPKRRKP